VPHAILFDLDETLIDRTQSIGQYAARFHQDFVDHLAPMTAPTIATTILTADERGYRPREALFGDLAQHLTWRIPPPRSHVCRHIGRCGSRCRLSHVRGLWRR